MLQILERNLLTPIQPHHLSFRETMELGSLQINLLHFQVMGNGTKTQSATVYRGGFPSQHLRCIMLRASRHHHPNKSLSTLKIRLPEQTDPHMPFIYPEVICFPWKLLCLPHICHQQWPPSACHPATARLEKP